MKNLRKTLGFTQEEFAVILGVSRPLFNMYERGRRSLPPGAFEKLSKIQLLLAENEQHPSAPCKKLMAIQQKHRQRAQHLLQAQAKKSASKAMRLSMQLSKLRQKLKQLENKLLITQLFLKSANPKTTEWKLLTLIERQLLYTLDTFNPGGEFITAYKLSMHHFEQQHAMHMHSKLKPKNR
ncbi:helix-turn-helix domain-containing protein [Niabella insulamsoli]|uniref:helix-turn-helix domain-containing protein n=1 Tax=Niabella insulamsoli TaxID=3144874 RepID=UPI0031FE071E